MVFVSTQELSYWAEAVQHAVVVAGTDATQIHLYDPAFPEAPRTISVDEFMLAWLEMGDFYALIQVVDT